MTTHKQNEWIEKYGKICGFYMGLKPIVLVAEPELAKLIQIKDFHIFTDRPHMALKHGQNPEPLKSKSIARQRGKRWKEVRSVLTPTFSGFKLKTMENILNDCVDSFITLVDRKSQRNNMFNIYKLFQNLSADVIGRTAFGVESNIQTENGNKFLRAAKSIFDTKTRTYLTYAIICFPIIDTIVYPFRRVYEIIRHKLLGQSAIGIISDMAGDIIRLRKQHLNYRRKDLLQLMLDSNISVENMSNITNDYLTVGGVKESNIDNSNENFNKSSDICLTEEEIIANAILFFIAGYETTSTALAFIVHVLITHPDIQEKCRHEVKELYVKEGKFNYKLLNNLVLMECIINETLRLYPPVIGFVSRECLSDYRYNTITIPKGATVLIAVDYLHHDPDYWPQPFKFDPGRFSSERAHEIFHSSSWQPFGSGPRNCICMRFALFEIKLALAKLLFYFQLETCSTHEHGDLETDCKIITQSPKYGVLVNALKL